MTCSDSNLSCEKIVKIKKKKKNSTICTKIGMTDRERKSVNNLYTFPGPTDLGSTCVFENVAQ